ncbi:MAG: type II toxin-antitoxin system RelE/ParE family toxin [Candidatus Angelobacter sp.]
MSTYWLHPDAFADLNDIWEFIAQDSVDAADRVLDEIQKAINMLVRAPLAGHLRPDLSSRPMRFWLVHSYLIAYVPEQPLLIIGVLHGRRNPRIMTAILHGRK